MKCETLQAFRFGATLTAVTQAVKIGFHMSPRPAVVLRPVLRSAMANVDKAHHMFKKSHTGQWVSGQHVMQITLCSIALHSDVCGARARAACNP